MFDILNFIVIFGPLFVGAFLVFIFQKPLKNFFLNRITNIEKTAMKIKAIDQLPSDTNEPEKKFYEKSIDFFDRKTNLFVIIASICTIISLAPLFLGFLLGENWFSNILAIPLGFDALMLIITASFFGASFSLFILLGIAIDFCNSILKNRDIPVYEKISTLIVNLIGGICIFCLNLFLVFVWFTKFDYITSNFAFPIFIALYSSLFLIVSIGILGYILEETGTPIGKMIILILSIVLIIALIATIIPTVNYISVFFNEKSKYYSSKSVNISIDYNISVNNKNQPAILLVSSNLSDLHPTKNISDFDVYYAQCRWSTNYGYFFTTDYNNSVISVKNREFIIPRCIDYSEKIYWTYEDPGNQKEKLPIYIGLSVDDPNRKKDYHLGNYLLIFNCTDANSLENVKDVTSIQQIPRIEMK